MAGGVDIFQDRDPPTTATSNSQLGRGQCERTSRSSTVTTAVLPWRTASDTHVPASSEEHNLDATNDGHERPRQWTRGTWRFCVKFWRAASTCSMGTGHSVTCSKKMQTQRHGMLVVHTCIVEPHDGACLRTLIQTQCEEAVLMCSQVTWRIR